MEDLVTYSAETAVVYLLYMIILRLAFILFILVTAEFKEAVTSVIDGDTIEVLKNGNVRQSEYSLTGIDCLENHNHTIPIQNSSCQISCLIKPSS